MQCFDAFFFHLRLMYVFLFFTIYIWLRELAQGKGYGRKREGADLVV